MHRPSPARTVATKQMLHASQTVIMFHARRAIRASGIIPEYILTLTTALLGLYVFVIEPATHGNRIAQQTAANFIGKPGSMGTGQDFGFPGLSWDLIFSLLFDGTQDMRTPGVPRPYEIFRCGYMTRQFLRHKAGRAAEIEFYSNKAAWLIGMGKHVSPYNVFWIIKF